MNKTIVIYHSNCQDGFSAAWIVHKAIGSVIKDITYHPGVYDEDPPDVTGCDIYIVDFSYKRPIMDEIIKKANKVIHIDHHDTAIQDMIGFTALNFESMYSPDNTESGAILTWKYFFPSQPIPQFIQHVDDYDRWQYKLPGTKEIHANMSSYEYTFDNWDKLAIQRLDEQILIGTAIERREAKVIKELLGIVVRRMNIAGYDVPVANVPYTMGSDICHCMAKGEPFSAYYYDTPKHRIFGLRSEENGLDVGQIAKGFGGGGHKHASGFKINLE